MNVVAPPREEVDSEPVRCIACGDESYVRTDGVEFRKGDWVATAKGVGKFAGVWDNPTLGLTSELRFYRSFDNPSLRTNLFFLLGKIGGEAKPTCLDTARKVNGPLSPKGKLPSRVVKFKRSAG